MYQNLIILSASQIFKTGSVNLSIEAFAKATGYSFYYVAYQMFMDQSLGSSGLGVSYIDDYKAGKITDTEFCDGMRYRLSKTTEQLSDTLIKECWNAMCEFPVSARGEIRDVMVFLVNNPNYRLICVNDTNPLQHEYNLEQFRVVTDQHREDLLADPEYAISQGFRHEYSNDMSASKITQSYNNVLSKQIHFINSFELGYCGKRELARNGIQELQAEDKVAGCHLIESIASLHNAIPAEDALIEGHHAYIFAKREYENIQTNDTTNIARKLQEIFDIQINKEAIDVVNNLFKGRGGRR